MTLAIFQILAGVLSLVASWYLGKFLNKWIQAYRDQRQKSEVEEARKDSQAANQAANAESDRLKQIDGR